MSSEKPKPKQRKLDSFLRQSEKENVSSRNDAGKFIININVAIVVCNEPKRTELNETAVSNITSHSVPSGSTTSIAQRNLPLSTTLNISPTERNANCAVLITVTNTSTTQSQPSTSSSSLSATAININVNVEKGKFEFVSKLPTRQFNKFCIVRSIVPI